MHDLDLPIEGRCRCGKLRVELSAPPLMTSACHCTGCQRMSASAFSLTAMVPVDGFRVLEGEPVKGGIKGPQLDHYFCPDCLTWMFTRINGFDGFLNIRPTMFDAAVWAEPFIECMTEDKLPWARTGARHSYPGFPSEDDYPRLLREFAESL
ncbi:GFA family protein [Tropicimonas sp. IMCC6043]|uniref:GFA family protein n=1 Tax=Tropicimonas sp. IMCC6043 TaxID=2510645 RepID=UPI00101BE26D|nr:GFA family protein [Tropicimonas sp. IMCC6043]RYH10632.1 GFA family protein [Tropicimonas sp. IMCC6043]